MTLREIDAKIAELMGWLPTSEHKARPRYSSDIAAAWTVVDRMKRTRKAAFVMGCNGCASQITVWFNDGIWALGKQQNSVPQPNDPHLLGGATAETAPLAICKAALRASGIDPDTGEEARNAKAKRARKKLNEMAEATA